VFIAKMQGRQPDPRGAKKYKLFKTRQRGTGAPGWLKTCTPVKMAKKDLLPRG
jgi:hypothetical protein